MTRLAFFWEGHYSQTLIFMVMVDLVNEQWSANIFTGANRGARSRSTRLKMVSVWIELPPDILDQCTRPSLWTISRKVLIDRSDFTTTTTSQKTLGGTTWFRLSELHRKMLL